MKKNITAVFVITAVAITVFGSPVYSQRSQKLDSAYIVSFPQKFLLRVLASQKYTDFNMPSAASGQDIRYYANSKMSLGVGGAYKDLSLSVLVNTAYLDGNKKDIGKTKGLDLQLRFTPYKWQIDAMASFREGNYLKPKGYLSGNADKYYFRPDVKMNLIGAGVYRVANASRYSPGAVLAHVNWQTKSAGSLLFGGEAYYGQIKGDSSIIPGKADASAKQKSINRISFINIGPGIGYGYTLVIHKHFYIAASVIANADLNITEEKGGGNNKRETGIAASGVFKGGIGYNSGTWIVGANLSGNVLLSNAVYSPKSYLYNIGEVRLTLAKRFNLKQKR